MGSQTADRSRSHAHSAKENVCPDVAFDRSRLGWTMKDILIGVAVFATIFGGALFGMFLGKILPDQHVSNESRDAIRIVMAMLATLSAVVLGLLTGSSMSSLGEKEGELRSAGVQFIMLDRALAEYGPETAQTRSL